MTEPFTVAACEPNGHAVHPPRPVCPHCGAIRWRRVPADGGVLEELTARRAIAEPRRLPEGEWIDQSEALLGRVRTDAGPVVICRVVRGPAPGGANLPPETAGAAPDAPPPVRVRLRTRALQCGSRVVEAVPEDGS